jgi:hypothetical protein
MQEFDRNGRKVTNEPARNRGAGMGLLALAAVCAVALALGLFFWSTMANQTASTDNNAPSLTTGAATSSPNNSGTTPPASR